MPRLRFDEYHQQLLKRGSIQDVLDGGVEQYIEHNERIRRLCKEQGRSCLGFNVRHYFECRACLLILRLTISRSSKVTHRYAPISTSQCLRIRPQESLRLSLAATTRPLFRRRIRTCAHSCASSSLSMSLARPLVLRVSLQD